MKTKTNILQKAMMSSIIVATLLLSSAFNSEKPCIPTNSQNEYEFMYDWFFLSSQKSINHEDDIFYICVSDPIKNWENFSYTEKEEIINSFRRKVNLAAGEQIINDYRKPSFGGKSNWEKFSSYDDCLIGRRDLINQQLEIHKDRLNNCPTKTITVELNKY